MKIEEIRALIEMLEHSSLNFMEIKEGNFQLLMGKSEPKIGYPAAGAGSGLGFATAVQAGPSVQAVQEMWTDHGTDGGCNPQAAQESGGEFAVSSSPSGQPFSSDAGQMSAASQALSGKTPVKSPMVGVFYQAASPEAEPFVRPGQAVKKGQVLCIVEAMKLMNEITAERDGIIEQVCVSDGDIVEYGQTLFYMQ